MKPAVPVYLWLAPALACVLPPLLLIPLAQGLPGAQFAKDLYELCLWLSPAIGLAALVQLHRRHRREPGGLRRAGALAVLVCGGLALVSPVAFFLVLAVLAGR